MYLSRLYLRHIDSVLITEQHTKLTGAFGDDWMPTLGLKAERKVRLSSLALCEQ